MVGCTGERSIRADFLWHSGGVGDPGKANLQAHTALRPHRPAVGLSRPAGNMEPRYFSPGGVRPEHTVYPCSIR
jgi:hypothetical protein